MNDNQGDNNNKMQNIATHARRSQSASHKRKRKSKMFHNSNAQKLIEIYNRGNFHTQNNIGHQMSEQTHF